MEDIDGLSLPFLDRTVDFPDGTSYELLQPLTNFRDCQDGVPAEARIVFTCKQYSNTESTQSPSQDEFVMKIKTQYPSPKFQPEAGPSTTTAAELKALEAFRDASNPYTPHLVVWKRAVQGQNGPLPGGFMTFTVMTKVPGQSLFQRFWSMSYGERDEIIVEFIKALRSIFALGIEPVDRALRNVLWENESKSCHIIDFELWNKTTENIADETKELQRWGLARRPPPKDWWAEWNLQGR